MRRSGEAQYCLREWSSSDQTRVESCSAAVQRLRAMTAASRWCVSGTTSLSSTSKPAFLSISFIFWVLRRPVSHFGSTTAAARTHEYCSIQVLYCTALQVGECSRGTTQKHSLSNTDYCIIITSSKLLVDIRTYKNTIRTYSENFVYYRTHSSLLN